MRFVGVAVGLLLLASCGGSNDSDTVEDDPEASTEVAATDATDERCVQACARLESCFDDFCDEQPLAPADCVAECDADPEAFRVDAVLLAQCAQINASICVEEGVDEICDCPTTGDDGAGCTATYSCFGECPANDDSCVVACLEAASPSAQIAVQALADCVSDSCTNAADQQACITENCSDELAECFAG